MEFLRQLCFGFVIIPLFLVATAGMAAMIVYAVFLAVNLMSAFPLVLLILAIVVLVLLAVLLLPVAITAVTCVAIAWILGLLTSGNLYIIMCLIVFWLIGNLIRMCSRSSDAETPKQRNIAILESWMGQVSWLSLCLCYAIPAILAALLFSVVYRGLSSS